MSTIRRKTARRRVYPNRPGRSPHLHICKLCGKKFLYNTQLSAHNALCKKNPKRQ